MRNFIKLKLLATSLALVGIVAFASTSEAKTKTAPSPENEAAMTATLDTSTATAKPAANVEELVVTTTAKKSAIANVEAANQRGTPKLSVLTGIADFTINVRILQANAMTTATPEPPKLEVASPLLSGLLLVNAKNLS